MKKLMEKNYHNSLKYIVLVDIVIVSDVVPLVRLGKGSLVCEVFLCYCHFPIWCPGSGCGT